MEVKRLDLGAEVVHIPSRDLLVIHPDLDYGEAIGAVHGTLPNMHIDVVEQLVQQVTARPKKPRPLLLRALPIAARMALASVVTFLLILHFGASEPATAGAKFGDEWQRQMENMGLTCEGKGSKRDCYDATGLETEIRGYDREDASLYVMSSAGDRTFLLIFDSREAAGKWGERHPDVAMTGRAAVWS